MLFSDWDDAQPFGNTQNLPRQFQMRHVDHLALHADRAKAWVGGEGIDYALGEGDLLLFRRESVVNDRDLIGMDRDLALEAGAAHPLGFLFQARGVAEVSID